MHACVHVYDAPISVHSIPKAGHREMYGKEEVDDDDDDDGNVRNICFSADRILW